MHGHNVSRKRENTGFVYQVHEVFYTIQGEGPFAGLPAVFVRLTGCNLKCHWCFPGKTKIKTPQGSVSIEDVQVGDSVWSWNGEGFECKKVTRKYESTTSELLRIEYGPQMFVFTTPEHKILVSQKGWIEARDVVVGDVLVHLPHGEHMRQSNPMKNPATAKKVSDKMKGKPAALNWLWDRQSFRDLVSKRMTENNPNKNPATAIKGFLNRKDRGKKTKLELKFEEIVKGLPLEFTGDGSLIVGNLCPDYKITGLNKLVEVWDSTQSDFRGRDQVWVDKRKSIFEKEGYETLFLPFNPTKMDKEALRSKVAQFAYNDYVVTSVAPMNDKAWARMAPEVGQPIKVYNLEVEDTHTYIANGIVVHNCDTTWNDEKDPKILVNDLYEEIRDKAQGCKLVVLTGGEPCRQELSALVILLGNMGYQVQVETAGSFWQTCLLLPHVTIVCSPKVAKVAPEFKQHCNHWKYVVRAGDASPIDGLPVEGTQRGKEFVLEAGIDGVIMDFEKKGGAMCRPPSDRKVDVYLQPCDEYHEVTNAANMKHMVEISKKYGYRAGLQLHKYFNVP